MAANVLSNLCTNRGAPEGRLSGKVERTKSTVDVCWEIFSSCNLGGVIVELEDRVSLQIYVVFDLMFSTVNNKLGAVVPQSMWQVKCGFKQNRIRQELNTRETSTKQVSIEPLDSPHEIQEGMTDDGIETEEVMDPEGGHTPEDTGNVEDQPTEEN